MLSVFEENCGHTVLIFKRGVPMLKFAIIISLGMILAVMSAIFVVKNFLVDYKGSESGFKNVSDILLIVVSLYCSLISIWGSFSLREILRSLENPAGMSEQMIQMLNNTVTQQTRQIIITIILGYFCFILADLIFKTIEKEIQRELDKPKRKWDWTKINKN